MSEDPILFKVGELTGRLDLVTRRIEHIIQSLEDLEERQRKTENLNTKLAVKISFICFLISLIATLVTEYLIKKI